jgi:predicted transposase YbfD/YdcC
MGHSEAGSFQRHFEGLQDPRIDRTRKHPLINIVFMTVCGVLSGSNSIAGIHEFAVDRRDWFARHIDLSSGVPSEDTFGRVLARLDPAAFEKSLLGWIREVQELTADRVVAIDGKTLRGSADAETGRSAIHMVSAWSTENKLSLGQVVVGEKSNEITAIPQLLDVLEVAGALVTIDAMGCQREIAGKIRDRGADYVLAVKQNQPGLYQRVVAAIDEALEQDAAAIDEHKTVEKGHGRRETRTYAVAAAPETVDPEGQWRDLSTLGIAISERVDSRGRASNEIRYYILSRPITAEEFATAVRAHWGIENNLHWQLDVSFREDDCRACRDHCPANLSVARRFALGLLKRETECKKGIEIKRMKCAASDEYREKVIFKCES